MRSHPIARDARDARRNIRAATRFVASRRRTSDALADQESHHEKPAVHGAECAEPAQTVYLTNATLSIGTAVRCPSGCSPMTLSAVTCPLSRSTVRPSDLTSLAFAGRSRAELSACATGV